MTDLPLPPTPPPIDAYSLLSKPTLDLTDAEVEIVVTDLRRRRAAFAATPSKPDRVGKPKTAAAKLTADEKKANTLSLLAQLKLPEL